MDGTLAPDRSRFLHAGTAPEQPGRIVTDDIDIWRAAKLLVDRHGTEAAIHAAMRADTLLDEGDVEGQRIWLRIVKAIEELLRTRGDDPLH